MALRVALLYTYNFLPLTVGFVVSDEGALQFLVSEHKAWDSYMEAAKHAFDAGMNIENSVEVLRGVYSTLPLLVAAGAIKRYANKSASQTFIKMPVRSMQVALAS